MSLTDRDGRVHRDFILGPATLFAWIEKKVDTDSLLVNAGEGVFRVMLFIGYLWAIGRSKDIHRVFEYHGAEHKTIAAYEHDDELVPAHIDTYPKEHVRCGTNFLMIVMIVTIFVFAFFGTPGLLWRIVSRLIAIRSSPRSPTRPCGSGLGSRGRS